MSVHYLPTSNAAPFPRKGPGRLPAAVASLRVERQRRALTIQPETDNPFLDGMRSATEALRHRRPTDPQSCETFRQFLEDIMSFRPCDGGAA